MKNEQKIDFSNSPEALRFFSLLKEGKNVFLTGGAGVGKSTIVQQLKGMKTATTGVASRNIGGVTLHSLLKIPFHPLLKKVDFKQKRGNKDKELSKYFRENQPLIIDEVSMCRADVLQYADHFLKWLMDEIETPFGGLQLVLVGDFCQLPPVLKQKDKALFHENLSSPFAFSLPVFSAFERIELKKVYRQTERYFIEFLNRIRIGKTSIKLLSWINKRADVKPQAEAIYLCCRNTQVDEINLKLLKNLKGKTRSFNADIEGIFAAKDYPAPSFLELKESCRVVFVKNGRDYKNGDVGTVKKIEKEEVLVEVLGKEVILGKEKWSNEEIIFNEKEKRWEKTEIGSFRQFPVKLGYAITVHRSQGMTFDKVVLDVGKGAFSHGQTYVALSRCRSLEGLTLAQELKDTDIIFDEEVAKFQTTLN